MMLVLVLSEQQRRALVRFCDALEATGEARPSLEDAGQVLFSTACSAWMDADPIETKEAPHAGTDP